MKNLKCRILGGPPATSDDRVRAVSSRVAICLCALVTLAGFVDRAHAIRILNYNILFYGDDATFDASRTAHFQTIVNAIQPDIICVQEVMNSGGYLDFGLDVLNGPGGPGGYTGAPFINGLGGGGDNAMYYRSTAVTLSSNLNIQTQGAGGIRDWSVYRVRMAGYTTAAGEMYLFVAHLSSGGGAAQRDIEADVYRDWAETNLPNGAFVLSMGDFNLENSSEAAWTRFTESRATNKGRLRDPINAVGNWSNNTAFAFAHTQSPVLNLPPGGGPYSTGGMDDRFDFILVSDNLMDGVSGRMEYISGTYRAWGNDGQHYNLNINDPPTIPEGTAAATALYHASDHLPVVMEVAAPAKASAPSVANFGTVAFGSTPTRNLTVTNTAPVPAMDLTFSFNSPSGFSAPDGLMSDAAGGTGSVQVIGMETSWVGVRSAILVINTNAPEQPALNVTLSGFVKRHAKPSVSEMAEIISGQLDFGTHPPGSFVDQTARAYNFNFNNFQCALDVYSADVTGNPLFSVVGFVPTLVTDQGLEVVVHFDDANAAPGPHQATLVLQTRDDPSVTGGTALSPLTYTLLANVETVVVIRGDMDGSGCVDAADVPAFITVVLDPDAATPAARDLADMNSDTLNDGDDITPFTAAAIAGCP